MSPPHRDPSSFPTRRSSDLVQALALVARVIGEGQRRTSRGGGQVRPPHPRGDVGLRAVREREARVALRRSVQRVEGASADRKSTRLNSSHLGISYAVFCLKK